QFGLLRENLPLGAGEHAVETTQDRERQDDVLVLAALEGVSDEVCDAPEKADDFTMVHSRSLILPPCRARAGAPCGARRLPSFLTRRDELEIPASWSIAFRWGSVGFT